MEYLYKLRNLLAICFFLLLPSSLPSGKYLFFASSGIPYKWDNTAAIPRDIDGGNFDTLIGSAAVTFAETTIEV